MMIAEDIIAGYYNIRDAYREQRSRYFAKKNKKNYLITSNEKF